MNWSRPRSAREKKNTYRKESFYGIEWNIFGVFCFRGLESKMHSLSNMCRKHKDRKKILFGFVHFVLCILNTKSQQTHGIREENLLLQQGQQELSNQHLSRAWNTLPKAELCTITRQTFHLWLLMLLITPFKWPRNGKKKDLFPLFIGMSPSKSKACSYLSIK